MDIRPLAPSDAPVYRALRLRARREHAQAFTSDHDEDEKRSKTRHKAKVVGMYVAPEDAGRGVGRALLDRLVAEARLSGVEPDAIRVDGRSFAKRHMYIELKPT